MAVVAHVVLPGVTKE
jgi:hypothetical protein